jgi:hypothetical protein
MLGIAAALNLADVVLNSVTKASHQRAFYLQCLGQLTVLSVLTVFRISYLFGPYFFTGTHADT